MKPEIFKSLGTKKQIAYVQRLEEINGQKQALIVELEKENKHAFDAIETIQCELIKKNGEIFNLTKEIKPWLR